MTQNPESEAGTGRARAWRMLAVLTAAQLIVAVAARATLWPPADFGGAKTLAVFLYWDLLAIGIVLFFAAIALLLVGRRKVPRTIVLVLASTMAILHCLLLAGNVAAIYWLRVPVTWQWLYFSDFGQTQTPLAIAGSVLTPGIIAGVIAALLAPTILWRLLNRLAPPQNRSRERRIVMALLAAILVIPLAKLSDPPGRDQWRDAVSNPGIVMARSFLSDASGRLRSVQGDGQTGNYAVRPPAAAQKAIAPEGTDIVLIVLESVGRGNVMRNRDSLPTINALIEGGTSFPNAGVTNSNSVRSIFELYFSRFPVVGYQPESYLYDRIDTTPVPPAIEAAGYRSALFMASDLGYQNAGNFLSRHGVGGLNDIDSIPCDDRIALTNARWENNDYLPDRCVFDSTLAWLLKSEQPAFATIWTGATHFPYSPPIDEPHEDAGIRHLQALQETDRAIGAFFGRLREAGRDPLVIIVGDHGEAFGKHGTMVHGYTVYEDETAIPFILSGPGIAAGKTDRRLATLADIGPTLAEYTGAARPSGWQGVSVLGNATRERVFRFALLANPTLAVRTRETKYVLDLQEDVARRYDLRSDPDEQDPQPLGKGEKARLEAAMAEWMRYNRALNEGAVTR